MEMEVINETAVYYKYTKCMPMATL